MAENQTPQVSYPNGESPQDSSLAPQEQPNLFMAIISSKPTCQNSLCGTVKVSIKDAKTIEEAINAVSNWMLLNEKEDNPFTSAEVFEYKATTATFRMDKWHEGAPAAKARLIETNERELFAKLKAKYEPTTTPPATTQEN